MKIPMEIPEAYEKATTEIIDFECEAEMVSALFIGFALFSTVFGSNCTVKSILILLDRSLFLWFFVHL